MPKRLVDHTASSDGLRAAEIQYGATRVYYNRIGDSGYFVSEKGDAGSILSKAVDNTWTLTDSSGTAISFGATDGSGSATVTQVAYSEIKATDGVFALTYEGTGNRNLQSISAPDGRQLYLDWGCAAGSVMLCILVRDSAGAEITRYTYEKKGAAGNVQVVKDGAGRVLLDTFKDSGGKYSWVKNPNDADPGNASPGYSASHIVNLSYGTNNILTSYQETNVHAQVGSTTSEWTFAYNWASGNITSQAAHGGAAVSRPYSGTTTVRPPRQQPSGAVTTYRYDDLGQEMQVVDVLGNQTQVNYNRRGQVIWAEDQLGQPTDNTVDLDNDVQTSSLGPDPDGVTGPLGRPETKLRYDEVSVGTSSSSGTPLHGLQGMYYSNPNDSGRPVAYRTDSTVDFNGTAWIPSAVSRTAGFSVRWKGNLAIAASGDYRFTTVAAGGVRLQVGNHAPIKDLAASCTATKTKTSQRVKLTGGQVYKVTLDYCASPSVATPDIHLKWECTEANCTNKPLEIVPTSQLTPAWNNQTSVVDPVGHVMFSHFAAPELGKPDYEMSTLSDSTKVITSYSYDAYGDMTQKIRPKGNAGRSIDAGGNLTGVGNANYAIDYVYYGMTETTTLPMGCGGGASPRQGGLLKSATPHGIAATTHYYDSLGRPQATSTAQGDTCLTYAAWNSTPINQAGRLVSTKAPNETNATLYTYDPAGSVRTVAIGTEVIEYQYDEDGRVVKTAESLSGAEATTTYDQEDNVRTVAAKASAGGTTYTWDYTDATNTTAYDAGNRLVRFTDPASRAYQFWYDARSAPRAIQYPNGTFIWKNYDQAGALTNLYVRHGVLPSTLPSSVPVDSIGSAIVENVYGRSLDGRLATETRTATGGLTGETTVYTYDNLGRLAQVGLPGSVNRTYGFDLDSNRTSVSENGVTLATYSYSATVLDQLASVTAGATTAFGYTSDGQVSSRGSDTLSWDGRGRHSGGTFGGTTVAYRFDPNGFRRTRLVNNVVEANYLLGGLFETNGANVVTKTDVRSSNGDLAHYAGAPTVASAITYSYYNAHGDLIAEADQSGARTAAYTYDPFGKLRSGSAPAGTTSERWSGAANKKLDSTSGLVEMGARPYDANLGRFYAIDAADGGSANGYDFANQDPINSADLDGNAPQPIDPMALYIFYRRREIRPHTPGGGFIIRPPGYPAIQGIWDRNFKDTKWEKVYKDPDTLRAKVGSGLVVCAQVCRQAKDVPRTYAVIVMPSGNAVEDEVFAYVDAHTHIVKSMEPFEVNSDPADMARRYALATQAGCPV